MATFVRRYAVKVVIRGPRETGKSSLFNRLQAKPFPGDYSPTPEIQFATIAWTYKNASDSIKVLAAVLDSSVQ